MTPPNVVEVIDEDARGRPLPAVIEEVESTGVTTATLEERFRYREYVKTWMRSRAADNREPRRVPDAFGNLAEPVPAGDSR